MSDEVRMRECLTRIILRPILRTTD